MRPATGLLRTLIVLLILRVVAAPITARPDTARPPSQARFIVRVCAWPAQRPQRLTSASILLPRSGNNPRNVRFVSFPRSLDRADGSLIRARLSRLTHQDTSSVHLSDCPRC